jgi:protein-S-isoprenylcysteine O-methyltransferase Ste14/membrane-associated phospholipid phosphatase
VALNRRLGQVLYGSLFCLVLPALLVLWAHAAEPNVALPQPGEPWSAAAWGLTIAGLGLMLAGMAHLWTYGKGLPMNPFPPARLVTQGTYRLLRHPIYTGFVLLCAGVAILVRSAAGLWLVTPVMALLCAALVVGHERLDLAARFDGFRGSRPQPLLGRPEESEERPRPLEKLGAAVAVFLPWLLLYEMVVQLGVSPRSFSTVLPWEAQWPVLEWTEIFYVLTYPFVVLVPFVTRSRRQLREFMAAGWWATAAGVFLQIVLPFQSPARAFEPATPLGRLLLWERTLDGPAAAFPSFHVLWALLAATVWSHRFPAWRGLWWLLAVLISVSCVTTGMHAVVDVIAGGLLFLAVQHRRALWRSLQRGSERLASSWREWRWGPFRIINHSLFAGLAGLAGLLIAGLFITDERVLLIVTLSALTAAAAWGQLVEGSPRLLRPFGYFGCLLGGLAGAAFCQLALGFPFPLTTAAFALAAPWVQAIGRLRCLVQGCCHGSVAASGDGIRYHGEHSRVCQISGLRGQPLHNTQLYSILTNLAIGLFLARLWFGGASPALLSGLYLILSGAGRFVEEAYRGEVQTRVIAGLRFYQWTAAGSVVLGAVLTTWPAPEPLVLHPLGPTQIATAVAGGLLSAFAMGMDFPASNVRFSRLSG